MQNFRRNTSINLGESKHTIVHVTTVWIVNAGRIIIVVTELILLIVLGWRFFLDFQLSNLHDNIKKEEGHLLSLQNEEEKYKDLQERLATSKTITLDTNKIIKVVADIRATIDPEKFTSRKFSFADKTINMDGEASDVFALDELIKKIKAIDLVQSIAISEVKTVESKLQFDLAIKVE